MAKLFNIFIMMAILLAFNTVRGEQHHKRVTSKPELFSMNIKT